MYTAFFFLIVIKNAFFNVLYFVELFYFLVAKFLYPNKPAEILLNFCIHRLWNDGFNMAAIQNVLMKSRIPQTWSCSLRQKFYSGIFCLVCFILLICQQRLYWTFLTFYFIFS